MGISWGFLAVEIVGVLQLPSRAFSNGPMNGEAGGGHVNVGLSSWGGSETSGKVFR